MIGILGGTFDPVHFGHLRTGVEVRDTLALRELRFIPCRTPPHRGVPHAAPEQRLAMVAAALQGESGLVCDDRELHREGPSYSVDTLAGLREECGDEALVLIVGADAFAEIATWHRWERLIELAHLVVVHRPGWEASVPRAAQALLADRVCDERRRLAESPGGLLWFQPVTPLQISASAIRDALRRGDSIRFLVPDAVERYIREHRLYRDD
jgi:nicotinate-nucleotide adenylyltransferase